MSACVATGGGLQMGLAKDGELTLELLRDWFATSPRGSLVDMVISVAEHPPKVQYH